jgi:cytochrome c553
VNINKTAGLLFSFLLGFSGTVFGEDEEAGEARYNKTCINCHGPAGKGVASYPKISGQEVSYTKSKLETYRDGIKIGPNSSLMIMMAKPLTDEEIENLAAYLKDATYE